MADQGEQGKGDDQVETTGSGPGADRGQRDAGTPGPDPSGEASGPGTGGSPREARPDERGSAGKAPRQGLEDGEPEGR